MSDVNYNSVLATRLRELLNEKAIKQNEIANAIGSTRQAISQYCDGSTIPNSDKLAKMAKYLNVSADYLLGLTNVSTLTDTDEEKTIRTVCDYTGLDENAVFSLNELYECSKLDNDLSIGVDFINYLLCKYNLLTIIVSLCGYISDLNKESQILSEFINNKSITNGNLIVNLWDNIESYFFERRIDRDNSLKDIERAFENFIEPYETKCKELEKQLSKIINDIALKTWQKEPHIKQISLFSKDNIAALFDNETLYSALKESNYEIIIKELTQFIEDKHRRELEEFNEALKELTDNS